MSKEITQRQKVFCRCIAKGLNQTQAAIEAGYSPSSANVTGSKLMKRDIIRNYVDYCTEKITLKSDYSNDYILKELLDIATLSKDSEKYRETLRALELLGKNNGMFKDKLEVSGSVGVIFSGETDLKD